MAQEPDRTGPDEDLRIDIFGFFVLEEIPVATINTILEQAAEDCGDYYLWLAEPGDASHQLRIDDGRAIAATMPPLNNDWTSPFLGRTMEQVADFVNAGPKPLNRVHFAVLDRKRYEEKDQVLLCKIVGAEVQAIPCTADEIATTLVGYDRDLWPEYWRDWKEHGHAL